MEAGVEFCLPCLSEQYWGAGGRGENSSPLLAALLNLKLKNILEIKERSTPQMNAEELKRRFAAGERYFTAVNLSKDKLIGAYLPGINLWGSDLSGANLAKAKLWGADLSRTNLANANLTRANLSGVKLNEANLRGAKLNYAKLYGANLTGAYYDESTRFSKGFDPISRNMQKV